MTDTDMSSGAQFGTPTREIHYSGMVAIGLLLVVLLLGGKLMQTDLPISLSKDQDSLQPLMILLYM